MELLLVLAAWAKLGESGEEGRQSWGARRLCRAEDWNEGEPGRPKAGRLLSTLQSGQGCAADRKESHKRRQCDAVSIHELTC